MAAGRRRCAARAARSLRVSALYHLGEERSSATEGGMG
jgi:hypothetical protein